MGHRARIPMFTSQAVRVPETCRKGMAAVLQRVQGREVGGWEKDPKLSQMEGICSGF